MSLMFQEILVFINKVLLAHSHAVVYILSPFLWWDWILKSGFCTSKEKQVLYCSHLPSVLLWLFWRWGS
jgi:hypothetical protein